MAALGVSHSASPFARAAPELIALGYNPLPIKPGEKRPGEYRGGVWQGMSQWERFRDRQPSQFELSLWMRNYPEANVGIVLGSEAVSADGEVLHVIAVDIDCPDHDDFEAVFRALPHSPMRKRGAKGETLFYLAAKSIRSRPYSRQTDRVRLVDVLTGFDARQTVCPPSAHPSGMAYAWTAGPCAAAELPVFTAEDLEKLEETLTGLEWEPEAEAHHKSVVNPPQSHVAPDEDDFFGETKRSALERLDAWVPALDLYGCRRARGGYEAVATWRPSGTGNPVEQRKRNLSIQANGITDFGDGPRGYSAIDLVMAAHGLEQAAATSWLRAQLGLGDDTVTIALEARPVAGIPTSEQVQEFTAPQTLDELPDALTRVPGLLGELTDWICDTSRRPQRGLALGAALTILGTAAGRKYAGPTRSGTHLYVLALARTGGGKDHALEQIVRALEVCNMRNLIGGSQFTSWQAVFNLLSRRPLNLCPMDEFGAFMQRINHAKPGSHDGQISAIFRTAWGASFKTMPSPEWAGRESEPVHSPAMSIYGASTPEEFYKSLSGNDVSNGLLNRFLLISTRHKPKPRDPKVEPYFVRDRVKLGLEQVFGSGSALAKATANNMQSDGPLITAKWATHEAKAVYEALELRCDALEEESPLVGRTAEMAIRIATIRAIGQDAQRPEITVRDMEWGRELAWWSYERMVAETSDWVADTPFQAEAQRVLRTIKAKGRLTRRDLARALHLQTKSRELTEVVDSLAEAGKIVVEKTVPPAGGTPSVWYSAT